MLNMHSRQNLICERCRSVIPASGRLLPAARIPQNSGFNKFLWSLNAWKCGLLKTRVHLWKMQMFKSPWELLGDHRSVPDLEPCRVTEAWQGWVAGKCKFAFEGILPPEMELNLRYLHHDEDEKQAGMLERHSGVDIFSFLLCFIYWLIFKNVQFQLVNTV